MQCVQESIRQLGVNQIQVLGEQVCHNSGVSRDKKGQRCSYERFQEIPVKGSACLLYEKYEDSDSQQKQGQQGAYL